MKMSPPHPAKRQKKTLLACVPCRSKKMKCDGLRPVCGACSKTGWTENKCIWKRIDGKEATVPQSEQAIRALQDRIQELEKSQQALDVEMLSPSPHIHDETTSVTAASSLQGDELPTRNEGRTGVSALVAAVTGEPQYEGFQGPSSAATFMSNIRQAVDGDAQPSEARSAVGDDSENGPRSNLSRTTEKGVLGDYVLPPRRVADSLLELYWTFIHPLYPVLNRNIFTQTYDALWAGRSLPLHAPHLTAIDEPTALCILNLALALSCQYSDEIPAGKAFATAEVFFARARGLFRFDLVGSTNVGLPHLQVMLLIAQYLQGTGRAYKAWDIVAVAIRNCHRLGFHLASTTSENLMPDIVERELVKRLYHLCVMTERMLCMTLGRPIMVSIIESDKVPLPLEIDDQDLPLFSNQSGPTDMARSTTEGTTATPTGETTPSMLSFFVQSAKLYRIVQQILTLTPMEERRVSESDTERSLENLQAVLKFDNELMALRDGVPSYLRRVTARVPEAEPGNERSLIFHRQSVVLYLRHLQARISLFRPILVKFCSPGQKSHGGQGDPTDLSSPSVTETLAYRTALQCSFLCVQSARTLINVMYEVFATGQGWGVKPNWLYGVLHIYISTTVLIAARIHPAIRLHEISESNIDEAWRRALKILETFQSDSLGAQKCVAALKRLHEKVMSRISSALADMPNTGDVIGSSDETNGLNRETAFHGACGAEGQVTAPFWSPEAGGSSAYHTQLETYQEPLVDMLDLSWATFVSDFPDSLMDPYSTVI
ncbi:fungal-specific transcription factor domain-containing protein [Aspergillus crustosus]